MLVLRRKASEAIVLNGVIKIYVLAVEGERVKLGIEAPPDVVIVRQELLDDISNENHLAGSFRAPARLAPRPQNQDRTGQHRDLQALLDKALSADENSAALPTQTQSQPVKSAGARPIIISRDR